MTITISLKRRCRWVWLYYCNEAGLLAIQTGPLVLEIQQNPYPR